MSIYLSVTMAPGFFERIQSKLELWRLEQRYTRRRNRRSAFVSNAIYVDGEYIYQTPNATGSSNASSDSHATIPPSPIRAQTYGPSTMTTTTPDSMPSKERKKLNRFSSMPGFGSTGNGISQPPPDWRTQRASFDERR